MKRKGKHITTKTTLLVVLLFSCFFLGACGSKNYSQKSSGKGYAVSKTAQTQIGKYYRFGGTSPKTGFDCSGLIMWAYDKHGIDVPRNTKAQATVGKKVHSSKARPGDIVVFRSKSTSSGYHTALYIGDNKFVHSPKTGAKVRIESLNTYWKPRLYSVRRVVK